MSVIKDFHNSNGVLLGGKTTHNFNGRHTKSISALPSNFSQNLIVEGNNNIFNHDGRKHIHSHRLSELMMQDSIGNQSLTHKAMKYAQSKPQLSRQLLDLYPLMKAQNFSDSFSPTCLKFKGQQSSDQYPVHQQQSSTCNLINKNVQTRVSSGTKLLNKSIKPVTNATTTFESSNGYFKRYLKPSPLKLLGEIKSCGDLLENCTKNSKNPAQFRQTSNVEKIKQLLEDEQMNYDSNVSFAVSALQQLNPIPSCQLLSTENEIDQDLADDSMNDIQELQLSGFKLMKEQEVGISPSTKINNYQYLKHDIITQHTFARNNLSKLLDVPMPRSTQNIHQINTNQNQNYSTNSKPAEQECIEERELQQNPQHQLQNLSKEYFTSSRKHSLKSTPFSPAKKLTKPYPSRNIFNKNYDDRGFQAHCDYQLSAPILPPYNSPSKRVVSSLLNYFPNANDQQQQPSKNAAVSSQPVKALFKKPSTLQQVTASNDFQRNRRYTKHHSQTAFNPKDYIAIS